MTLCCLVHLSLCSLPPTLIILIGLMQNACLAVDLLRTKFRSPCPPVVVIGTMVPFLWTETRVLVLMTLVPPVVDSMVRRCPVVRFLCLWTVCWTLSRLGEVPLPMPLK